MKQLIVCISIALLSLVLCGPQAEADPQGPANSVAIFNGVGTNGMTSSSPITNGCFVSKDSLTKPEFAQCDINVTTWGADSTGVSDSTSAINAAFTAASTSGRCVYFPSGTYSVSTITFPGLTPPQASKPCIYGDGASSFIEQNATAAGTNSNILVLGTGTLNGVADGVIRNISIKAALAKSAGGAGIFAKGAARLTFENVYLQDGNMYNGIELNGVQFHRFSNVQAFAPLYSGILLYDAYDCGFTPASKTTNGTTSSGAAVVSLSSTTGLSAGMVGWNITRGVQLDGTISSISAGVSVTMSSNQNVAIGNGDTIRFGGSCAGTGATIEGDSYIFSAGLAGAPGAGIHVGGGVGGVYIGSSHIYTSRIALDISTTYSSGIQNREVFLLPGQDFDTNQSNLIAEANSVQKIVGTGCWLSAATTGYGAYIYAQGARYNPPETGAEIVFNDCDLNQNAANGIVWLDNGVLTVSGSRVGYNGSSNVEINPSSGAGNGKVTITGSAANNSGAGYGLNFANPPAYADVSGNYVGGNSLGGVNGLTPSAAIACSFNVGGSGTCDNGATAGGDLSGFYPNPTVAKINGVSLGTTTATSGNLLIGSGTQWVTHAMSGDATLSSSGALTLASTITAGGPTGSATIAPIITYDAKGRLTAVSSATITPAVGSITGLGTGIATWLATPSSANLAAAITDETGSGALVFGTTPTLATPVINGLPTGTGVSNANTASTVVTRDASGNIRGNIYYGGTSGGTFANYLNLSSSGSVPQINFALSDGAAFNIYTFDLVGTGDIIYDIVPSAGTGWTILETQTSAGLLLATVGSVPISLRPNRVEKAKVYSSGAFDIGAGYDAGDKNLTVGGSVACAAPVTKTGTSGSQGAADCNLIMNPSGTYTLTLLAASSYSGRLLYIRSIAAQAVNSASSNVVPLAGGAAGTAILAATAGKWAILQSNGTNWEIIAAN